MRVIKDNLFISAKHGWIFSMNYLYS